MGKDLSRINLSFPFTLSRNIGIDLGTSATLIYVKGKDYPGRAFRSGLSKK